MMAACELHFEDEIHSPTSEDSIEVRVGPILAKKNKRKLIEPRKLDNESPAKKRVNTALSDNKRVGLTLDRSGSTLGRIGSTLAKNCSIIDNKKSGLTPDRTGPTLDNVGSTFDNKRAGSTLDYPNKRVKRTLSPFRPWSKQDEPLSLVLNRTDLGGRVNQDFSRVNKCNIADESNQEQYSRVNIERVNDGFRTDIDRVNDELNLGLDRSSDSIKERVNNRVNNGLKLNPEGSFASTSDEQLSNNKVKQANVLKIDHQYNGLRFDPETSFASTSDEQISNKKTKQQNGLVRLDHGLKLDQPVDHQQNGLRFDPETSFASTSDEQLSNKKTKQQNGLVRLDHGLKLDQTVDLERFDGKQRNYKNMTRERRIEANARERTRVHTISAAFDTLRQTIPSYSNTQKLSKLSILRIACSYIVALSRVNGMDYSEGQTQPTLSDCVDTLSKTLHAEGKVRKKKDE